MVLITDLDAIVELQLQSVQLVADLRKTLVQVLEGNLTNGL